MTVHDIVDLDIDFDLDIIAPQDLLESLGLSDFTVDTLLSFLKRGSDEVKEAFDYNLFTKGDEGMKVFNGIGKKYAPIAFAIYDRLFAKGEEPRLPTYLAVNRAHSTECKPDTVIFWADPDLITGLYKALKKDGYYAST